MFTGAGIQIHSSVSNAKSAKYMNNTKHGGQLFSLDDCGSEVSLRLDDCCS